MKNVNLNLKIFREEQLINFQEAIVLYRSLKDCTSLRVCISSTEPTRYVTVVFEDVKLLTISVLVYN